MSRMITAREIESEYGVPANAVRSAVKRFHIECQNIGGFISISLQDAEKLIFDYHAKQDSYTWQEVAKKLNASPANTNLKNIINFEEKYDIRLKLSNFDKIQSQLEKPYPVETVNLFGFSEYMIPWKYMEQLMEDYHIYYILKAEVNPYEVSR